MENTATETKTYKDELPTTVEGMNKKIARTIFFKDRMIQINDDLKAGKTEKDLEMSVFEIELRAKEGNFKWFKQEDGKFVKLYHWDVIQRCIDKIKMLRGEKTKLVELQPA